LQERWKGLLPILWGQQLRQERLNELIYISLLNAEGLPGPKASRLAPLLYRPSEETLGEDEVTPEKSLKAVPPAKTTFTSTPATDVLVIGAGLAGLVAAWQATSQGLKVRLISKGWGTLYWHAGCVDVWGTAPSGDELGNKEESGRNVRDALSELAGSKPQHPYSLTGLDLLNQAVEEFQGWSERVGYPLQGSLDSCWQLPTGLGTSRRTCLAPITMLAGDLRDQRAMAVVGFEQYVDLYPRWIADNLRSVGVSAEPISLCLDSLDERKFVTARVLAEMFETPEFREIVAKEVLRKLRSLSVERVGFPAVLGLLRAVEVQQDLEEKIGLPVFEIPTLPPSIPGIRLHKLLIAEIEKNGGRVLDGMQVIAAEAQGDVILGVWSEAAARPKLNRAGSYILATGGIMGGGFWMDADGRLREKIFDLPLMGNLGQNQAFERSFLDSGGQPIFRSGVVVNQDLQPITPTGDRLYKNLSIAGAGLAYCDPIQERSVEGIALVTGYVAGSRGVTR
jgi:glycerol-3-phosphate dehydrogenase subunit B